MALPIVFGNITATSGSLSQLDQNFNALAATIPVQCTAAGTNNVVLTPLANQATVSAYQNYIAFLWVAVANSTGVMTLKFGSLAALNLYGPDGTTQFTTGSVILGSMYISYFNQALNGGLGGFTTISATPQTSITLPLAIGQGGTGKTTAAAARSSTGLNIDQITITSGNASYTILSTDRIVGTSSTAMAASQTWTLPAASSLNPGQTITVEDMGGVVGTFQIAIQRAGGDTVNGGTVVSLASQFGNVNLTSDGVSKWNATISNVLTASLVQTGFINRVINGSFAIDQRNNFGALGATAIGAAVTYICDRWWGITANPNATGVDIVSGNLDFNNALRIQRANGTSNLSSIFWGTVIETNNCQDMAGASVTLSFYAQAGANFSSAGGLLTVGLFTGTAADQGSVSLNNGTWTGSSIPINATQAITTTRTRYSFTATIGASVKEIGVRFSYTPVGTAGAADLVDITGVQLEQANAASVFERRPIGYELLLCQRYFEIMRASPLMTGGCFTATQSLFPWIFEVEKRVVPTATYFGANTDYQILINGGAIAPTVVPSTNNASTKVLFITTTHAAQAVGSTDWMAYATVNSRIQADADL